MTHICLFNPNASDWNHDGEAIRQWAAQRHARMIPLVDAGDWLSHISNATHRPIVCGGDGTLSHVVDELNAASRWSEYDYLQHGHSRTMNKLWCGDEPGEIP